MLLYAAKRVTLALLITVLAVILMFLMIHAIPGDPASIILGPRATVEMKAALGAKMGLDRPLAEQAMNFLGSVMRGDLGTDVFSNRPVVDIVFEQLPYTIELILAAIAWASVLGICLGCFSAVKRDSIADRITGIMSVAFIAAPAFVVALYSLLIFAVSLKWLPAIGAGQPGDPVSRLSHLLLPAFAIGLSWVGYIARMVRATMLEVLGESHILTARAFGIPERRIIFRYALRLAVLPTITLIGVGMSLLLSAAVFVEIVFARPGVGKLIIDSITTRNYPIVMGSVLISAAVFVASTTISDLVNAALDPRVRANI